MIDVRKLIAATCLLTYLIPVAQVATAEETSAESVGLTEIIVTARKRDEKLLDVPVPEYAGINNLGGNNLSTEWSAVVLQPRTIGFSLGYKF